MSDPRRATATGRMLWLLLSGLLVAPALAVELEFGGYYKNLLIDSRTSFPLAEDYVLDLNRLRLEMRGRPNKWLGFEVSYDNEALLGSYLDTAQFQRLRTMSPPTYWDLEDDYVNRGSLFVRHRLYRGYVDIATPLADVLVGRQRVAWGSGRFWNPTDLLNPFNPIAIEREERQGVDALLVQRNIAALSRLSFVYAPQRESDPSRGVQYRTNIASTDVALMAGEFRGDRVVGLDLVGRLGEGGVRLEAAHTNAMAEKDYTRAVAGFDYAFANTLTVTVEYYYNGQGASDISAYDFARLQTGFIQNVGRRYVGGQLSYEITPLLRTDNVLIVNADDNSHFLAPKLAYAVTTNLEWAVGMQLFAGEPGSEFDSFNDTYFTHLQYFF